MNNDREKNKPITSSSIQEKSDKIFRKIGGAFDEHLAGAFEKGEFRHPRERVALIICWIFVILVIIISSTITFGMIFIYLVITGFYLSIQRAIFTANNEEVNRDGEHAWLYEFVHTASKKLELKKTPPLFIIADPSFNAYTTGLLKPYIVLFSGVLNICDKEEIKAIIAHELGHIKFRHVFNLVFIDTTSQLKGFGTFITIPLWIIGRMLFLWGLYAEYTADRTALWICRDHQYKWVGTDIHPLAQGLLKISSGQNKISSWEDIEEKFKKHRYDPFLWIAQLFTTHPHIYRRTYFSRQFFESLPPPQGDNTSWKVSGTKNRIEEFRQMLDFGRLDDSIQMGNEMIKIFLQTNKPDDAVDLCKRFHEAFPESSFRPEIQFALCKQLKISGEYDLCAKFYKNLALCHKDHPLAPRAIIECARVLFENLNDYYNAETAFNYFKNFYPSSDLIPLAKQLYKKLQEKMKNTKPLSDVSE